MLGRAAGLAAVCAVVLAQAAAAGAGTIFLLSPIAQVDQPPPLLPGGATRGGTPFETRFRAHVNSKEAIDVRVDGRGRPVRIAVTQRLRVTGTGDYSFLVPGPVTSVVEAAGSESRPGLRDLGIVWQGFADRGRTLAATATVALGEGAKGLPLRISIERREGRTVVRLVNATGRDVDLAGGTASAADVRATLLRLRDAVGSARGRAVTGTWQVPGTPSGQVRVSAAAPLRVTGTISSMRVDTVLGSGGRTFGLPGSRAPRIALRVDLLGPLEILPQPDDLAGPMALRTLQSALARAAVSWQYGQYLASPDDGGASSASYSYRTAAPGPGVVPVAPSHGGGGHTLAIVLAATLGAAGLLGLAVLWARS